MTGGILGGIVRAFKAAASSGTGPRDLKMGLKLLTDPDGLEALAFRHIRGSGIEIGALHTPLKVSSAASVKYVDRLPVEELRRQYPELKEQPFVKVDVVSDGEKLAEFQPGSLDFVIANHFLEHCENPLGAIESFLRVLKTGGTAYLAVPDKRFTFDAAREVTSLEHLARDYREGPAWSRERHFSEWRELVERQFANDQERSLETLKDGSYSIHFHVWTFAEILELLAFLKKGLGLNFELVKFVSGNNEIIFILRKN